MEDTFVKFPFGSGEAIALTATGAQAVSVSNDLTILDGVSVVATGNRTIDLTIDDEVATGALLFVKSKTTATETTIFGTNITSATITGVAGKTITQGFIYDGSVFLPLGTSIQID